MTTKAQLAQYCADHPVVHTVMSTTFFHAAIAVAVSFVVGAGIAWYIRGRGMSGVKIDAANVETEAKAIETKVAAVL